MPEKPTPENFGLTHDILESLPQIRSAHYKMLGARDCRIENIAIRCAGLAGLAGVVAMALLIYDHTHPVPSLIVGTLVGLFGVSWVASLIGLGLSCFIAQRVIETPKLSLELRRQLDASEKYESSLRTWEASQEKLKREYWLSLDGWAFEHAISTLFRGKGYTAFVTPGSNDGGVDIVLVKDQEKVIVQCKNHRSPAAPAMVRDLYGSMVHEGAASAILVCTGGFTSGTKEFAKGKPIELIDLEGIITMAM
jgi:hypothetical protein